MPFTITHELIDPFALRRQLASTTAGGFCCFEGWVRNHHLGMDVLSLEYEAYVPLACKQGELVLGMALERYDIEAAVACHRIGKLQPGDLAVWIGVTAAHRDAAFMACRYLIDTIKDTVPIWKHEFYIDGTESWVDPTSCSCAHSHQ